MLTVMCPNCRHRFPAPGCCNPDSRLQDTAMHPSTTTSSSPVASSYGNYYSCGGGLMMPRSYGSNCIINAPTIIHGPTIIQSNQGSGTAQIPSPGFLVDYWNISKPSNSECKINTTCDLTGGTVTITTPNIQSGGYLLQPTDSDSLIHSPRIEIRPKLSGGGCLVQKRLSEDNSSQLLFSNNDLLQSLANFNYHRDFPKEEVTPSVHPPSGCQELPGMRRDSFIQPRPDNSIHDNCNPAAGDRQSRKNSNCCCSSQSNSINNNNNNNNYSYNYNSNNCSNNLQSETVQRKSSTDDPGAVQIKVSATIQLPANVDQCTLNITATKSSGNNVDTITTVNGINSATTTSEAGNCILVQMDTQQTGSSCENERREDTSTPTPTTPVSWLMPVSYNYDEGYSQKRGLPKTTDIKKLLSSTGWYYEGMNWQQSENLLKNMEIGRWLVRDSSDSRFVFAISVQTDRGPTSVRVHFYNRNFRLDSEPQLIMTMPQFDCPIKLLDYYIYVSKHGNGNLKQVWVDLTGHLYSKIYLTKPVVKDVGTLSHLARLVINKHKIDTKSLPIPIKNYIAEYPYTF
ncbi:hybrid signal transduction histidine kinase I-like [Cotesia glomerata]|uniref:SH2 domain-containing protein n=1 Tax=Cotesia glomerata TaxID=32391 RepID=A0AAV7I3P8_COTGL|nr:hybrid signal transduction histidine kinase I-like [Cotesia glomerata]XP_044576184.1 hybrid signal transduction histidine kinase I-like [Cotesia glomerata]KAH0540499.1 hypothetical protein KQX54_017802 [Cotesia glomerata]